jgi:hypothetical protein
MIIESRGAATVLLLGLSGHWVRFWSIYILGCPGLSWARIALIFQQSNMKSPHDISISFGYCRNMEKIMLESCTNRVIIYRDTAPNLLDSIIAYGLVQPSGTGDLSKSFDRKCFESVGRVVYSNYIWWDDWLLCRRMCRRQSGGRPHI